MPLTGVRAMVVEDEGFAARHLSLMLRKANAEVVAQAQEADTAVDLALERRPDLIVIDQQLTGSRSGLDAAAEIAAAYCPCIVLFTANPLPSLDRPCVEAVLNKPMTSDDLLPALTQALARHRAGRPDESRN